MQTTGYLKFKDSSLPQSTDLIPSPEGEQTYNEIHNDLSFALGLYRENSSQFYMGWRTEMPAAPLGYKYDEHGNPRVKNPYYYFTLHLWRTLNIGDGQGNDDLYHAIKKAKREIKDFLYKDDAIENYRIRGQGDLQEVPW